MQHAAAGRSAAGRADAAIGAGTEEEGACATLRNESISIAHVAHTPDEEESAVDEPQGSEQGSEQERPSGPQGTQYEPLSDNRRSASRSG